MKKFLIPALILVFAVGAKAGCSIHHNANSEFARVFDTYDSWDIEKVRFDQICEKLNRASASVLIEANAVVLNNQSIGYAEVRVIDRNLNIFVAGWSSYAIYTSPYASQDKANELMVRSANEAIEKWTSLDKALVELEKERAKVRAAFSRQK